MASLGDPKTWAPYMNNRDCSQGFCSIYCPKWCYMMFPPPPPFAFPDDNSSPSISPLVIAIIGILASGFLLLSYYTIISKYCGISDRSATSENQGPNEEVEEFPNPTLQEPWHIASAGLDESLIKTITVCKFKKGNGLVEGRDCSVCLSEFQEDESVRLLPKCSHAFHLPCIDTWLKSHSNCPLCRANIICTSPSQPPQIPTTPESPPTVGSESYQADDHEAVIPGDLDEVVPVPGDVVPKSSVPALSDLENPKERDAIIEIADEGHQPMRRSVSMDHLCQNRVLVSQFLNQDREIHVVERSADVAEVGSSKQPVGEEHKCNHRKGILHCVMSPVAMKRSLSSGRFLLSKHGRGHRVIIPV